jgi:hypothetical protein
LVCLCFYRLFIGCPTSLVNQINEINAAQGATVIANQDNDAKITTSFAGSSTGSGSGESGTNGAIDQGNKGYTPKDTTQVYNQSTRGIIGGPEEETKKKWIIFFIFFIILVLICAMAYLFLRKRGGSYSNFPYENDYTKNI